MMFLLFMATGNVESIFWWEDTSSKFVSFLEMETYESIENIEAGVKFLLDNEEIKNKELFKGFSYRFLTYTTPKYSITVGNFYKIFGSGLVLAFYEDRELFIDKPADGIIFNFNFPVAEGSALVTPVETKYYTTMIYALEVHLKRLSFYYSRLNVDDTTYFSGMPYEEWVGSSFSFVSNNWEVGIEYVKRFIWGEYSPIRGWYRGGENGYGVYGYFSFTHKNIGCYLDFKDYYKINGEFNLPPACTYTGESLNQGYDEKGGEIEINFSFPSILHHTYNIGYTQDHDGKSFLKIIHTENKIDVNNWSLIFEVTFLNRNSLTTLLPGTDEKKVGLKIETCFKNISPVFYVNMGNITEGSINYKDLELIGDLGVKEFIFSIGFEHTTSVPIGENRTEWYWTGLQWQRYPFYFSLNVGIFRGKYTCKSGICRYEPPFRGIKAEISVFF